MDITDYKGQHIKLMIAQTILITLGLGNVIYQLFLNIPNMFFGASGIRATYITTFLAYIAIIVYAFWGYKNSIVPFRLAFTAYEISIGVVLARLLEAGIKNIPFYVTLQTLALLVLSLVFDNTFKKHKKPALISGGIMVALEISRSAVMFISLLNGGASTAEIAAAQPFANFFLVSALFITYASRCHWSTFGKLNMFD